MEPTRIASLEVRALDVALHEPFGISGGAQSSVQNLVVTVRLEDGTLGYGEAAPFPAFNGETQTSALAAVEEARSVVVGVDARGWRSLAGSLAAAIPRIGSARCAIEVAVLDALTTRVQLPLWSLFGGAARSLVTDVTITTGAVSAAAQAAKKWREKGFSTLKLKIGGGDVDEDVARILAVATEAPRARLVLDGNAAFHAEDALRLLREVRARGVVVALFEQPVGARDLAGMARVAEHVRVVADESCASAADVVSLARLGAAHVVNIKLMKSGVAEALAIAETARALGLGRMIGGMVETKLAMSASACFAAGLGGFELVDLDTPLFLVEDPFRGGYAQSGDVLDLSFIAGGHGTRPR